MTVRSYKDLKVWQKGMDLVMEVYRITDVLPTTEQFGLISQMRRAAVSVPANIAEGYHRQHNKELCQFLYVSSGSLAELETHVCICERLGYLNVDAVSALLEMASEVGKMLNGLIAKTR